MTSIFSYIKTHKFLIIIGVLVLAVGVYFSQKKSLPTYETTTVKKGEVVQRVSVTGRVESESEASLSFERTGRVSSEPIPVGTRVKRGDVLVRLDATEVGALRAQALANLAYENARLAEIEKGSRPEDIDISRTQVNSAQVSLENAESALLDKLNSALTTADDGIYNKTDHFFDNPRTANAKLAVPVIDQKLGNQIESERVALNAMIKDIASSPSDIESRLKTDKQYLSSLKRYFDDLAQLITGILPSSQYSQTTLDGWKSDVSFARSNLNTAVTSLLAAEQAYRSADSALTVAKSQLSLKEAGATPESIAAQEAKIASVRASVASYDAQIAKSVLVAPFSGVVTKQDAKMGQTVAPNVALVSLMSDGGFKITANVPEVDVAKLTTGAKASVTLDAYGPDVEFPASVSLIDPAETIIEGVSTYKVTLRFVAQDERIRSGMTANIDVETNRKDGVLYLPARAVVTKDGKKFVKVPGAPETNATVEKEVTTGLRGSNGMIEILSGLTEGEVVVTLEK